MAAAIQRTTVVGVFEDRQAADAAVNELRREGFREDQIGLVTQHPDAASYNATAKDEDGSKWETGAVTGALAGLGLGGLIGLGVLSGVIPVVGPAIMAGTLGTIFSKAVGGAALVGITGALVGAGIPEEEAHYYEGELKSGRTLVTVKAETRFDEATKILRRHGAYDMQTRGTTTAATTERTVGTTATGRTAAATVATGERKIEVREEELHATKRPVEVGEVRVHKEVHTEHRTLEVPVEREEVVVERRPASGHASASDIREGEELRIPVKEEEVIVEKRPVVTEEVVVGKRTVHDTEKVAGTVRKEEVKVEREGDVDVHATGDVKNKRRS